MEKLRPFRSESYLLSILNRTNRHFVDLYSSSVFSIHRTSHCHRYPPVNTGTIATQALAKYSPGLATTGALCAIVTWRADVAIPHLDAFGVARLLVLTALVDPTVRACTPVVLHRRALVEASQLK
jgi:hypothetical protein